MPQISRAQFISRPATWRRTLTKSSHSVNHTYCQDIVQLSAHSTTRSWRTKHKASR